MRQSLLFLLGLIACLAMAAPAAAGTAVPGHDAEKFPQRIDTDENGIPDEGIVTVGHYNSVYAEDAGGAYWWDLGAGRIYSSPGIESIADLNQGTLTVCDYVVNYRGTFENDPCMDTGYISNLINCRGNEPGHYNYLIVNESDPRYRGIPEYAIWGNWEYHVLTESGNGNLVRPEHPVP